MPSTWFSQIQKGRKPRVSAIFFWWAQQGSSLDFLNSPSAPFGRRLVNKIKALQTKTGVLACFCLAALSVRSRAPKHHKKSSPCGEFFYGGRSRDRTCDPYRVNGAFDFENSGFSPFLYVSFCRFLSCLSDSLNVFRCICNRFNPSGFHPKTAAAERR